MGRLAVTVPAPPCAGRHDLAPAYGDPVWCPPCAWAIAARLADLDDLVALLEAEVAGQRGTSDDAPVTGSKGSPSPSPAVDDIDEITRLLEYHEDAYRELRGLPRRPVRGPEMRVAMCAGWLGRHIDGLLASPLAEEFGRDVSRLHAMARRRTRTDQAKVRKPAPCPRCDTKALTHHDGDRYVVCESCGRLMTLDEYDAHAQALTRRTA